jgi:hypothetical protein
MKFLKTLLLGLFLLAAPVFAQNPQQNNSTGSITATATNCGLGNSTSCVVLPLPNSNRSSIVITVTGTWTGTLNPIATNSTLPFSSSLGVTPQAGGAVVTTITSNGSWVAQITGQTVAGVYASVMSGTAVVTITSSVAAVSVLGAGSVTSVTGTSPVASSGGSTPAISINANGIGAAQLAAQYSVGSCTELWGGSGAAFALTAGDDAISNNSCYNDSGVTRTITAVKCRSDNGSNTTTVNPTFGSTGTGTTILSGALTCGNSLAYSATGTVSNAAWTTGTGITPAMGGSLTGTSIAMIVEYTY